MTSAVFGVWKSASLPHLQPCSSGTSGTRELVRNAGSRALGLPSQSLHIDKIPG